MNAKLEVARHASNNLHMTMSDLFALRDCPELAPDELSVTYVPSSMRGNVEAESASVSLQESFLSLTLANIPQNCLDLKSGIRLREEELLPNNPNMQWLVLQSRPYQGIISELLRKPKRSQREVESLLDMIRDPASFSPSAHIGAVDVSCSQTSGSFHGMTFCCAV